MVIISSKPRLRPGLGLGLRPGVRLGLAHVVLMAIARLDLSTPVKALWLALPGNQMVRRIKAIKAA